MMDNPSAYAITEEDLEMLNEISLKLNSIPEMGFFSKPSKNQMGRRGHPSSKMLERSKSSALELKIIVESDLDHLESSQFDPNIKRDIGRSQSPRNMDYREELKSKGLRLDLEGNTEIMQQASIQFNPHNLVKSFDYFADITKERAIHYKRFRLAAINSDLSLRAADMFL